MLSTLDPSAQQFLTNLNRIGDRMQRAQQQMATGLKLTEVSDQPDSVSTVLTAHAALDRANQTISNLGRIKTEVDTAEQALGSAVSLFDKVQTLGAQGATDTATADARNTIAKQLDNILEQLVGLANTSIDGRYVFSGDSDQTTPYVYNSALATPVSAYQGSSSTRLAQDSNGSTFQIALTAQQIFDSTDPTTNAFSAIQALSTALKANDSAAIQAANGALSHVGAFLNYQLAFYGNVQARVADATDDANNRKTALQTEISGYQNADLTESILNLTQAQTQQQASLQARAQIPRKTLFDFIA